MSVEDDDFVEPAFSEDEDDFSEEVDDVDLSEEDFSDDFSEEAEAETVDDLLSERLSVR